MEPLLPKADFLKKFNISEDDFTLTTLEWSELNSIYEDYVLLIPKYEALANYILNLLIKEKDVHSIRFRVKDPEHLIQKIIRKRIDDINRVINLNNYREQVTDLLGFRVLHLFKDQWSSIHDSIINTWETNETPIIYHRDGDIVNIDGYEDIFEVKQHKYGYRSFHYIIKSNPSKESFFAEIQVRTIYEEAWSEIDHTIRYPYDLENPIFKEYLSILNRLSGMADEMGTFIKKLDNDLKLRNSKYNEALHEIDRLQAKIDKLVVEIELKSTQKLPVELDKISDLKFSLDKLKTINLNSDFSSLNNYHHGILPIELDKIASQYKNLNLKFNNLGDIIKAGSKGE